MTLQAIKYSRRKLEILDQLRLPHEEVYIDIKDTEDAWNAIKSMQVRGAPAIAIVAALSIAVQLAYIIDVEDGPPDEFIEETVETIDAHLEHLVTSRPTAVNLADAAAKLKTVVSTAANESDADPRTIMNAYIRAAERMLVDDVQDNERIGRHGAEWILQRKASNSLGSRVSIITHCNTGPYNQGARLTGYELIHDEIPATLITDSMAAALMRTKGQSENITAVIVGADRVAANGDTANKIGTYALAVLARYHGIKFLVAAPRTTVDMATKSGADIIIEERPEIEVVNIKGPTVPTNVSRDKEIRKGTTEEIYIAARNTRAWNPAFDVTPAELIDGIVTEQGVVGKDERGVFRWDKVFGTDVLEKVPEVGEPKKINMLPDGITPHESASTSVEASSSGQTPVTEIHSAFGKG
ncbi:MAG: hypothetical protein Q9209_001797 [Squamulea sp. 1 TL-2023]